MSASENSSFFHTLALSYDDDFTHSLSGRLQRDRVWHWLEREIQGPPLRVLEINCGTGEDAIWMSRQGHQVIATDASQQMIDTAKRKAGTEKELAPEFECCPFNELNTRFSPGSFDLIFSNFAGLNCVNAEELQSLNRSFAQLLKPGGKLVIILLGKKCWTEKLFFTLKQDPENAGRRKKGYAVARLRNGASQPTWYFSLQECIRFFSAFSLLMAKPIGLFIPPSYLEERLKKNRWILGPLRFLETVSGNLSAWADYGDHIYISLRKN